jgi:hypothetical protein
MADKQQNTVTGGNKPKPTGNGGQSAKDKSRAASRPVTAKGGGGGKGGNTPRPGKAKVPSGPSGSRVVIGALFIVKVTSNSSPDLSYTPVTPAPAQVVSDVTNIPLATWNKVGITSQFPVTKPTVLSDQSPMTLNGKTPAMLYYGAEYCPFCAAQRWVMATTLARFGTWTNLSITASSHSDLYPATNTFSFHGATLDSPYITFAAIEQCTNIPDPSNAACSGYTTLQSPTKEEAAILSKYSSSKYLPNASTSGGIAFPFVDVNNGTLFSGASYDPQILAGQTWSNIAGGLSDASNPTTQAILAAGNYMSASICQATHGQPGNVCTSSGVQAAAKALGIQAS